MFIMPKHVFYDLFYATTCPTWLKKRLKMSLITSNQLYDSCNQKKWFKKTTTIA
jgi:hypothetical protein